MKNRHKKWEKYEKPYKKGRKVKKGLTKEEGGDIIIKLSNERGQERGRKNNLKKVLDKRRTKWYNIKVVLRSDGIRKSLEEILKEILKKHLTNGRECDIILKLSVAWQKVSWKLNNAKKKETLV